MVIPRMFFCYRVGITAFATPLNTLNKQMYKTYGAMYHRDFESGVINVGGAMDFDSGDIDFDDGTMDLDIGSLGFDDEDIYFDSGVMKFDGGTLGFNNESVGKKVIVH